MKLLVLALAVSTTIPQAETHHVMRTEGTKSVCTGATLTEIQQIQLRREKRSRQAEGLSFYLDTYRDRNFIISYDSDFPEDARDAFQAAVNIWDSALLINIPIRIEASWEDLSEEDDPGPLAQASGYFVCDTDNLCWSSSLANQLDGKDWFTGQADMEITVSNTAEWYFGLDRDPYGDSYDFISVILHEIGHGLGITSVYFTEENNGTDVAGYSASEDGNEMTYFDFFLRTREHGWLDEDELENPSTELHDAITGNRLLWGKKYARGLHGVDLKGVEANGGPVMIWSPEEYSSGSSVSHLDEDAYPEGSPNELMTPWSSLGVATHEPGPVTLGILYDLGWELKDRGVDPLDVLKCLEGR